MKKFFVSVLVFIYIFVTSPVALIAQSIMEQEFYSSLTASKVIEKDKGGEVSLGSAKVVFPEGVLREDTEITVQALLKTEDTGESIENVTALYSGYRFLPSGEFEGYAYVYIPYSPVLNSSEGRLEELYTYFYDEELKTYIPLERVDIDRENCLVISKTNHFTDMINGTLTLPESPDSPDISLNSIKSLESATPDSHLIKFNAPRANNSGDASFSFVLDIPSGRGGMQPSVAVSYSSSGGNSEMGKGFTLNTVSSVTIDTRHGVPEYDTKDTYMLDGVILEEKRRTDTTIEYGSTRESDFKRIIRYNVGAENVEDEYWEVTDKSGVKRTYGRSLNSTEGSSKRISQWNITEQKDIFGNSVRYSYIKDSGKSYISEIRYTNWNFIDGNYSIKFNYDNSREDIRVNARSTEIIETTLLLTSIETYYKTERLRTYSFDYNESMTGEKMLISLTAENSDGDSYTYSFEYEDYRKTAEGVPVFFSEPMLWDNGLPLQVGRSTGSGTNYSGGACAGVETWSFDVTVTGG